MKLFSPAIFCCMLFCCGALPAAAGGQNRSATDENLPRGVVFRAPRCGAEGVNPDTRLVLRFRETPTLGTSGWIRIFDAQTGEQVDSLDLSIPAGPTQSRTYGPECDYTKVPYDYSRERMPTNRDTRAGTPSGTAEPTPPDYQLTIIGGFTDGFHFHPVLVRGTVATICPHHNMLEYGHTYVVTVDDGVLSLPDGSFRGITREDNWHFTTKPSAPTRDTLVVDAGGRGDFNTVQGALDHVPDFSPHPVLVEVREGDYEEIVYARNKTRLTIRGAGMGLTRVHYANNEVFNPHPLTVKTNEWPGTFPSRRAAFMLDNCSDIVIEDLTVATDLTGQAEGLLLNGERIALYGVHIIGSGDALQANGTIYMEGCELDGGGDTFLGRGSLFAYRCNLRNDGGPFSWVRNTKGNHGDVFVECTFATTNGSPVDYGRTKTNKGHGYPDAEFVVIDCRVKNSLPAGWSSIGYESARCYEYNTRDMETGEPVDVSQRHPWSRQLDPEHDRALIANYRDPAFVLKGWQPERRMRAMRRQHRAFRYNPLYRTDERFFATDEARRIGDRILDYQRCTGGWPKNIDMAAPLSDEQRAAVLGAKARRNDSTTDNGATTTQMTYLARLYRATGDERYRDAFRRGVEYLLSGQYENGGWPQFWPEMRDYQIHITFNDDAMVHTLTLLQELIAARAPYDGDLIDTSLRGRMTKAFDKGIECILKCQIVVAGRPTIWCQQHDRETYAPASARAYELPSFCPQESASIVRLLMSLPDPDARVRRAVHGAMAWFDRYKLSGLKIRRTGGWNDPARDTRLVEEPGGEPLWGRFYDLKRCEPYVCDRDGLPRRRLGEIGPERRNGYSWYGTRPAELYPLYEAWADRYDPRHKVALDLYGPGANEMGLVDLWRRPTVDSSLFDAVVHAGESIQAAIEQAPEHSAQPYKILIRKGIYNQKVIIDRPNIVLVGENRDSTVIRRAETAATNDVRSYRGRKVGNGVVVLLEGADDCLISGLTVYNDYGTTVELTTTHQMAIAGRATRTIVINCNVWADGNDALALWAPQSNGMYYHADLDLRCPGVDFLCPRGWCYATRCRFYGDSRAIIWHDGRGDRSKKLVITNSVFDAASPTKLGRWHRDSQFFLVNCHLTKNILDSNISYAYTDKVLDPCPWGERVYYSGCTREGGHSGWLADNLHEAEGGDSLAYYTFTAPWTFDGRWDPEQRIRDLWDVVAYEVKTQDE